METSHATGLSSLLDRLTHTRRLLEHQLWEAARSLSVDRSSAAGRRLASLIEAGAMLDATLLLVAMSRPSRFVSSVTNTGASWKCAVRPATPLTGAAAERFSTEHADLPAAVLAALISSLLNEAKSPQAKGLAKPTKGNCIHHDT